jgi:hypothetical protein
MKFKLLVLSLLGSYAALAQNMISMTSVHPVADTAGASKHQMAIRYPALRQFNVVTTSYRYADFDAELNDEPFPTQQASILRTAAFFNTPAVQWRGNTLSATVFYTYTSFKLKAVANELPEPQLYPLVSDKSTVDLALNYSRADSLFRRPVIYSLIVNFISGNLSSVRRFNFNGSISFPLIRRPNTTLAVGLLVVIDPSSPVPVEPIVNYYHKFTGSGLELLVDIPSGINLKKQVVHNLWVLAGSNQNSYTTFYNSHEGIFNGKASYNTIEVRSGLAIEYLLAQKLMLSLGGGINNTVSARVFRSGEDYNSASVTSKNGSAPYVNVGLSWVPF